jgi:hypothetical protein
VPQYLASDGPIVGPGDPGAVGAGMEWINTTTGARYIRNGENSGWIGGGGGDGGPGATGPQGPAGPQGPIGPEGPQGANGSAGEQGPAGPQGPPGPNGNDGPPGADGLQGPPGADGAAGAQGPAGNDGAPGTPGVDGAAGAQGPKGDKGDTGIQGQQGLQGQQGIQGIQGPPGDVSAAWPVGSVFISVVSTNPATLLGLGTWVAFGAGRVLVGLDAGDPDFDAAEKTGGAKTHQLSVNELPAHNHTVTDPGHTHLTQRYPTATGASTGFTIDTSMSGTLADNTLPTKSATTGLTVNNAGGGAAHNNVQPFVVCYFWKRTA